MDDTISKQDAIDAVIEWYGCKPDDIEALEEIIKAMPSAQPEQPESAKEYCAECDHIEMCRWYPYEGCEFRSLPSAQPEQRWIPCSERLPEENEVVLTQARFADDIKMAVSARIDYNYWTGWGTREVNVVAWMPLPPVYQEGDNK